MIEVGKRLQQARGKRSVSTEEPAHRARWAIALLVIGVVCCGTLAFAQTSPGNSPSAPPGNYGWVLDLGAPGILLFVLVSLWASYKGQAKTHREDLVKWGKDQEEIAKKHEREKAEMVVAHEKAMAELVKAHEKEKTELSRSLEGEKNQLRAESKEEKASLRKAFEAEKATLRTDHKAEIDKLQESLSAEQSGRRKEVTELWQTQMREGKEINKELMATSQKLVAAITQNSELMALVREALQLEE